MTSIPPSPTRTSGEEEWREIGRKVGEISPDQAAGILTSIGLSEATLKTAAENVGALVGALLGIRQCMIDDARAAQTAGATLALEHERARRETWVARDIRRIRRLSEAADLPYRLTADEEEWIATVQSHNPKGRPHKSGPTTATEQFAQLWAWSQMPRSSPTERRQAARKSPWFPSVVSEAYATEYARLKAQSGVRRRARSDLHLHEVAEAAVAEVFGISAAKVRKLKANQDEEASDPGLLARHRDWILRGLPAR